MEEKEEKLTPGQEILKSSSELDQLFLAMSQVQGELEHAKKSTENKFFKANYADLAEVLDTGRKVCAKHGISVIQFPKGESTLVTVLAHKSGQYMMSEFTMVPGDKKPQTLGSLLTYARRYAYSAVVGIAPDEDDDGNAASGRGDAKPAAEAPYQKKTYPPKGSSSPLKTLNR